MASSSSVSTPSSNNITSSIQGPLRSLTISKPNTTDSNSDFQCKLVSNIILVAKFSFFAEGENEINVNKGEILKLLDRFGNGWLLVKFIDKLSTPGLIPASYCDIAINDATNPVTLNWLHQVKTTDLVQDHNYLDLQFKKQENKFKTINNKAYPISASISNFLLYENRNWYRLDIGYSNNSKSYVCRYYQDFYNLHIDLLKISEGADALKLPKLPEPIPSNYENETDQVESLLKRCNDLNVYINKLILNKYYQISPMLIEWLESGYNGLPGFEVQEKEEIKLSNDEINEKILRGSINVLKHYNEKKLELIKLRKEEELAEEANNQEELPTRSKSKNIYNNYQQASNALLQRTTTAKSQKSSPTSNIPTRTNTQTSTSAHNSCIKLAHTSVGKVNSNHNSISSSSHHNSGGNLSTNSESSIANSPIEEEKLDTPNTSIETNNETTEAAKATTTPIAKPQANFNSLDQSTPPPKLFTGHQITPQPNYVQQTPSPQLMYSSKFINSQISPAPMQAFPKKSGFSPRINTTNQFQSSPNSKMSPLGHTSPIFPIQGFKQPQSPGIQNHNFIKCKILNYNNEIIAIKFNKNQIKSIQDLKRLIKQKVYYSKLYIKLPNLNNYENIDIINFNILEFLKFNDKVLLKIN
ncbi:unnamed protein product [Candida verbasci]|uniref:SH3 domain-containing protein n=1 Tax=Candida verbasci TaxID=1227364 RepID=A0A9W4TXG0_9ASCO|nr:unnamed protein product [Candida verbasci]